MGITDSGDREHVARTLAKVEKGRDTLLRVLSQAKGRTPEVDREFESKFRDLRRRLDDSEQNAALLPHREKYLRLVVSFLRHFVDLHEQLLVEVECKLAETRVR